jgi:hypothetical protein
MSKRTSMPNNDGQLEKMLIKKAITQKTYNFTSEVITAVILLWQEMN